MERFLHMTAAEYLAQQRGSSVATPPTPLREKKGTPTQRLLLPFPPTINHYWHFTPHGVVLRPAGRAYRRAVCEILLLTPGRPRMESGLLRVDLLPHPPDRRRRDLDNLQKSLLDALQHAEVYRDDSQIIELVSRWGHMSKPGYIEVSITPLVTTKEAP